MTDHDTIDPTHTIDQTPQPAGPTDSDSQGENDTEGHSLWINPSASYDMAKARNKDIERQAREHQRQKEARTKGK
ncbi:MAG: hypothetical protein LH650_00685 [Chloroflexi bacterium]|nr:hypothetical protein [Chloroflexota bacterium]